MPDESVFSTAVQLCWYQWTLKLLFPWTCSVRWCLAERLASGDQCQRTHWRRVCKSWFTLLYYQLL